MLIYIPIYPTTTAAKECLACSNANLLNGFSILFYVVVLKRSKNDPCVSYHGSLMELHLHVLVRILLLLCEHKLHSVGHTVNCVHNENQKVQLFLGWLSFTSSPWGLKQTCMLARHRLHKSARCFNKFGSKSLCLFHIDLKIIPPMSYVICCLP